MFECEKELHKLTSAYQKKVGECVIWKICFIYALMVMLLTTIFLIYG